MKQESIPKIKNTVGFALLKNVFSLYVIIAVFITLLHMYSEYDRKKVVIKEDMINIGTTFKKQLATSIWTLNYNLLEEIIDGILTSRSIIGVTIKIKSGDGLGNFGTVDADLKKRETLFLEKKTKVLYKKDLYSYSLELKHIDYERGAFLGTLILYSDENVIYQRVKENFFFIILNSIIKTFALWIIFLYFARKHLTLPLFEIIKTTDNLDFQKLKKVTFLNNKHKQNEFEILKSTFNKMIVRLKKSQQTVNKINKKYLELNKKLEYKVNERTLELAESNDELEQSIYELKQTHEQLVESEKMASLGGLVAGVAHEINTPIGIGLTGITHLLLLTKEIEKSFQDDNISKEELQKYLSSSKELSSLINVNLEKTAQLVRSFKQVAVDQTSEEIREFNLKKYINSILFSLNNITKKTNINIQIHCSDDLALLSYPGAYSQIFTNLIINSIKHGFKENQIGEIHIGAEIIGRNLKLTYKDNGNGISSLNLPKIFDPFFTTNREAGGTGLGLNIIYNIITNNLHGTITCNSREGKGVEFIIVVPKNLF